MQLDLLRSLVLAVLGTLAAPVGAAVLDPSAGPMLLVDTAQGRVLEARDPDQRWFPASLAKLMTLYLTFEALDDDRLVPGQPLPVSTHAADQPPSRLGLRPGETITVRAAVEAVATVSANDAAVVLAEALAGGEAAFVVEENRAAARLGLSRTRFRNATGLPGPGQWTTARDMARLAVILHARFPRYRQVFSLPDVRYRGRRRPSHNAAMNLVAGGDGLKTGFTCDAGYNIVLSAERSGRRLIAVVLGAPSRGARDRYAARLMRTGFASPPGPDAPSLYARPGGPASTPPPRRLGPGSCGSAPRRWVRDARALRGWGIFLGVFTGEASARERLERTRTLLAARSTGEGDAGEGRSSTPLPATAQAALLPRSHGRRRSWKLVLAGLTSEQAGGACRRLTRAGSVCVAQSPARLALPGYAER